MRKNNPSAWLNTVPLSKLTAPPLLPLKINTTITTCPHYFKLIRRNFGKPYPPTMAIIFPCATQTRHFSLIMNVHQNLTNFSHLYSRRKIFPRSRSYLTSIAPTWHPLILLAKASLISLTTSRHLHQPALTTSIPKYLRTLHIYQAFFLFHIFRQSLSSGHLPEDWKIGKIVPIFGAGNRNSPDNYRPISLTCICGKLLEHVIVSHIFCHLESNHFFFPNQYGFRKNVLCDTQLS